MDKLKEVFRIANNALYIGDNMDYETALCQICIILNPDVKYGSEYMEKDD